MPAMTSKIAIEFARRIEALQNQIHAIYREAGELDGSSANNVNTLREIVDARREAEDASFRAEGLVEALDQKDVVFD